VRATLVNYPKSLASATLGRAAPIRFHWRRFSARREREPAFPRLDIGYLNLDLPTFSRTAPFRRYASLPSRRGGAVHPSASRAHILTVPLKEINLLLKDLLFFANGKADLGEADTGADEWLYPLDLEYQLVREDAHFAPYDANGIPIRSYRGPLSDQYLYSRITAFAIAHWNRWRLAQAETSREAFLRTVTWLAGFEDGRFGHDFPAAGMKAPWISCISQGEAGSVLARAYLLTDDERFLNQARKAVGWLLVPVAQGGTLGQLPDGQIFLEEYPDSIHPHVLNGCLYAVIGIHDVLRVLPEDRELGRAFEALIEAIGSNLAAWDAGGWSIYDYSAPDARVRNFNTMTYQVLQVVLLKYLGRVSGDRRLIDMATRWEASAARLPSRLRALRKKVAYRLATRW
jgi:hypothetical protein